jgi:hypothetical protein
MEQQMANTQTLDRIIEAHENMLSAAYNQTFSVTATDEMRQELLDKIRLLENAADILLLNDEYTKFLDAVTLVDDLIF